jgi:hypothetical protein
MSRKKMLRTRRKKKMQMKRRKKTGKTNLSRRRKLKKRKKLCLSLQRKSMRIMKSFLSYSNGEATDMSK